MSDKTNNWADDKDFLKKRSHLFKKVFDNDAETEDGRSHYPVTMPETWEAAEYFHALADSMIQSFGASPKVGCILSVTSSYRGEGVTTIASRLAAAIAEDSGRPVALVDAHVSDPRLHTLFKASLSPGFSEVICEKLDPLSVIQSTAFENLSVMTAGSHAADPVHKCAADGLPTLIDTLREHFGYVIFDSPPMDSVNVVIRMAHLLDGVLLAIESERVRWEVAQRVKERLVKANAPILGVVLNKKQYHIPKWLYKTL